MKKLIPILLLVVLGAVILFAFNSGAEESSEATEAKPLRMVEVVTPEKINFRKSIVASGQLASKEETKLSFKTGGIIKNVRVSEGQFVRKGQLMAELNMDEINAQAEQAQLGVKQSSITLENAKLALKLAERDYRNTKGLYEDSVATLEQLENVETQLSNARNQIEAAQTGLDFSQKNKTIANFNVEHSRIVAPASGMILKKLASSNELIGPGNPVFLFGSKEQAQVIRISLTDKDIIHVNLGDKAQVKFDAYPNQSFEGTVRELASMADPYTGTYEVEVQIRANGNRLLNGFIGRVELMTKSSQDVLSIPIDALVSADKNTAQIFIIENELAQKRSVEIFEMKGKTLLIQSGLDASQQVVASGAGYLEDGEKVNVQ